MDMDDFVGGKMLGLIAVDEEGKEYGDGCLFEASPLEAYQLISALCQIRSVGEISLVPFLGSCEGTATANTTNIPHKQPHSMNDSRLAK